MNQLKIQDSARQAYACEIADACLAGLADESLKMKDNPLTSEMVPVIKLARGRKYNYAP